MSASASFANVTLGYRGHPAVHHLAGEIRPGALLAVFGPNGSGKSTLLKGLVGLIKPMSGTIALAGCEARDIAYLPQAGNVDTSLPVTVEDLLRTGLWRRRGPFAQHTAEDAKAMARALDTVGLNGFARRNLSTLSGGQFQRALFARVILQDAKLILLDEPFAAIDAKTTADLLTLIGRWHEEGRTVVAVLHDPALVRGHFPETLLMAREPLGWGDTVQVMTDANLAKARRIHEAWDEAAPDCEIDAPHAGHNHDDHDAHAGHAN